MTRAEGITILAKLATLGLLFCSVFLSWVPSLSEVDPKLGLTVSLLAESIVFISSISPLSIFSIYFASVLVEARQYDILIVGYFFALSGNFLSFLIGRSFSQGGSPNLLNSSQPWLTYWHPQLASLTAFQMGLAGLGKQEFLRKIVPPALTYYCLAVLALSLVTSAAEIPHQSAEVFSILIISAWLFFDIFRFFRK